MKKKIKNAFIIGSGGHARVIVSLLQNEFANIYKIKKIFSLDKKKYKNDNKLKIPIEQFNLENIQNSKNNNFFIAVGDVNKRKQLYKLLKKNNFMMPNLISKFALVDQSAELGLSNIILPFAKVGPFSTIKDNILINNFCNIEHEVVINNHCNCNPGSVICGRSILDHSITIGANATVIENIKIKNSNIIGAGSVVIRNINTSNNVYVGIPAKILKK